MRIISDFKDYYDCIQRNGQDMSVQYIRKKKETQEGCYLGRHYLIKDFMTAYHFVGFCGKIYPCIETTKYGIIYDYKDIEHLVENKYDKSAMSRFFSNTQRFTHLFKEAPIFRVSDRIAILNCNLKELEFYKIFSPYLAYQEIYMYLASQASPEKPIPHISDEDLASAKGFDKWSFRKPPKKE